MNNKVIRDSNRSIDINGYMEIKDCVLTEAGIAEYLGKDFYKWQEKGLKPMSVYKVYRPLEVLEASVNTFNNMPVTLEHPDKIDASTFSDVRTYGTTGEQSRISDGKLLNNIVIHDDAMIALLEESVLQDLSCGYYWDVEKATGEEYDFIITSITGNHVAIVENPRIEGAKIADSSSIKNKKVGDIMKKVKNSFKNLFVKDSETTDSMSEEFMTEFAELLSKHDLTDKVKVVLKDEEIEENVEDNVEVEDAEVEDAEVEVEDSEVEETETKTDSDSYTKDEVNTLMDELREELKVKAEDKEEALLDAEELLGDVDIATGDANSIRVAILDAKGISSKGMDNSAVKGAITALKSISKQTVSKGAKIVADSAACDFTPEMVARFKGAK